MKGERLIAAVIVGLALVVAAFAAGGRYHAVTITYDKATTLERITSGAKPHTAVVVIDRYTGSATVAADYPAADQQPSR